MNITIVESRSAQDSQALEIEQSGMVLTLKAGTLKIAGEDLTIEEDFTHTVDSNPDHPTELIGYLVKNKSDGALNFLVDEIVDDGVDEPYKFPPDGPYDLVCPLFDIKMLQGVSTLDDATAIIYRTVLDDQPVRRR